MSRFLIMAGEASGDLHGAKLATELRSLQPHVELLGLGGPRMRAAGVQLLDGIDRLDIIGLPSVSELRQAIRTFRALAQRLQQLQLDAVILIDNPGLNLRLAKVAKRAGHRVIYFVAPQIWAWNGSRIKKIKKYVDLVLVILPFEEEIYRRAGIPCRFVGHPLLDDIASRRDRAALRAGFGIAPEERVVGLLPGSRVREAGDLLPIMLQAAERLALRSSVPVRFLLGQAPSLPPALVAGLLARSSARVTPVIGQSTEVMAACDMLFVASGTATLQSAVVGTPLVIVYRASRLTAAIAKRVIKVRWLGLANLVAGRSIAPELLQEDLTPERLLAEAEKVLLDPDAERVAGDNAQDLRRRLGPPGAALRAAQSILAECGVAAATARG